MSAPTSPQHHQAISLPDRSYIREDDGFYCYKYDGLFYLALPHATAGREAEALEYPITVCYVPY